MNWACESPHLKLLNLDDNRLISNEKVNEPESPYNDLNELIKSSEEFPIKFPIETIRCKTLKKFVSESILLRNANSSYPILHESVLPLFLNFILHKRKFGSNVERKFYKDVNFLQFINRLLTKRAVMFINESDQYVLLNGRKGEGKWETIGTDTEKVPLTLANCLSYDEVKLSAFLSVSSYTYCINNGNRHNLGSIAKDRRNLAEEVVIIGVIGARLEKDYVMEYQDVVIDKNQNVEGRGYGTVFAPTMASLFSGFYGKPSWTYESYMHSGESKFVKLYEGVYFDNATYSNRIAISIDTLLFEANHRAKMKGVSSFIHVVGIGLGVWRISSHQQAIFMDTFAERIE